MRLSVTHNEKSKKKTKKALEKRKLKTFIFFIIISCTSHHAEWNVFLREQSQFTAANQNKAQQKTKQNKNKITSLLGIALRSGNVMLNQNIFVVIVTGTKKLNVVLSVQKS